MPLSASPCVAITLGTCAIGHQARSPGLCRSLHPENVVLTGGRLPVSAPPHVSSHRVIVGVWPAGGRPWEARSSARCSQWPCRYVRCHSARSLRTRRRRRRPRRPVRWCPSACGFVAVVRGSGWLAVPFEARSSARCWQWPCRYVRCLSACSLRTQRRRWRPRRPVRSCPTACGFVAVVRGSGWLAVPFEARRLLGAGSGPAGASGASLPARCVQSTGDGGRVVRPVRAHLRAVVVELLLRRLSVSAH